MFDLRNQDTAELVRQYTIDIKAIMGRTAQNLVIIGQKLQAVRRLLPHGAWLDWLVHEFHWSERTARNLMSVASRFKSATVADLPIEIGALYVLSAKSTPAPAVEEALRLAKRGEVITQAKAKDLLKQHKTWGNERVVAPAITESASSEDDEPDASHAQDLEAVATLGMKDAREAAADDEDGNEILSAMALPMDTWDPIPVEPEPEEAGAERDPVEPDETAAEDTVQPVFPSVIEAPALILTPPAPAPARGKRSTFNRTNEMIDWAKWSWNPVTGCLHGCDYCYARDIAQDLYPEKFTPTFRQERLSAPHHTRLPREADEGIGWLNVFVCSMADLFGKWVPQAWIDAVLAEVRAAPQWNFLFLTKFPQRLAAIDWPANAWVGTTVDEQYRVKIAEKAFRDIKASVKWLSCEPLRERLTFDSLEMFDWVVIGGQSASSGAPAFQPPSSWVEHLLFQARGAGCKVFCKENLHVWPREYPGQRPESLDLPTRRPAVERPSGGEGGAIKVPGSGSHPGLT
jgi:protein gp37